MRVIAETAKQPASDLIRVAFVRAACGHAMVRSPDEEDAYPGRLKYIVDGIGDFVSLVFPGFVDVWRRLRQREQVC